MRTHVVFAFRHAALMRGFCMGCPGGFFQNAKTFAQAGDDLLYQSGFIHFKISSLILEYNPFKELRKAPYPWSKSSFVFNASTYEVLNV
ncbi:MAG TPA: hypothetical protein VFC44_26690 [Candidatus Saccharimonadales bacterium]|nr:hypothetical protein [Candidatus Saccharimonadales bacterium]